MEDNLDSCSDSSFTHAENSYAHSNLDTNTLCAINMAQYLNLSDPNNPFWLYNDNNVVVILVTDLLTIDNYATWLQAMQRALCAKNKLGFTTSVIPQPTDPAD